ncbi:MAG: hypothetical protein ACYCOU_07885 [Sulfobacillus sp.]
MGPTGQIAFAGQGTQLDAFLTNGNQTLTPTAANVVFNGVNIQSPYYDQNIGSYTAPQPGTYLYAYAITLGNLQTNRLQWAGGLQRRAQRRSDRGTQYHIELWRVRFDPLPDFGDVFIGVS